MSHLHGSAAALTPIPEPLLKKTLWFEGDRKEHTETGTCPWRFPRDGPRWTAVPRELRLRQHWQPDICHLQHVSLSLSLSLSHLSRGQEVSSNKSEIALNIKGLGENKHTWERFVYGGIRTRALLPSQLYSGWPAGDIEAPFIFKGIMSVFLAS